MLPCFGGKRSRKLFVLWLVMLLLLLLDSCRIEYTHAALTPTLTVFSLSWALTSACLCFLSITSCFGRPALAEQGAAGWMEMRVLARLESCVLVPGSGLQGAVT